MLNHDGVWLPPKYLTNSESLLIGCAQIGFVQIYSEVLVMVEKLMQSIRVLKQLQVVGRRHFAEDIQRWLYGHHHTYQKQGL